MPVTLKGVPEDVTFGSTPRPAHGEDPQHFTSPEVKRAQFQSPPRLIWVAPEIPEMEPGCKLSLTGPGELGPQHRTAPLVSRRQLCAKPAWREFAKIPGDSDKGMGLG